MKTICLSLCLVGIGCLVTFDSSAQITAHRLTKKITDANAAQNQSLNRALNQPPATRPTPPSPSAPVVAPPSPRAQTNIVSEKTEEQKRVILQKTIEFQMKRAEAGASTAQYDLGMRYLNGDGLEKNPELAQKWLNSAATNGNAQAIKKLKELSRQ
jgi:TPR repeat protein